MSVTSVNRKEKRFRVALSFPGEHRSFVQKVATCLCSELPRESILYDQYYEAEFARPNLDTYLLDLYRNQSDLVVIFLCAEYERKEWCRLEWRAIRDLLKQRDAGSIMPFRFDDTEIPGLFSLDGYVRIDQRSPADVAALILERLGRAAHRVPRKKPEVAERKRASTGGALDVISTSGNWILLGSEYFVAKSVRKDRNGTVSVEIATTTSAEEVALRSLNTRPLNSSNPFGFAHGNDALIVRAEPPIQESTADETIWKLELKPEQTNYGGYPVEFGVQGYSSDDLAQLRASRILLNDPPPVSSAFESFGREDVNKALLENAVAGMNTFQKVARSPLIELYPSLRSRPQVFMQQGRLLAILFLKLSGVIEHVVELTLGPIRGGKLHVQFTGKRRKVYVNQDARLIQVDGDCTLE
jgi:TIR domain